MDVSFCGTRGSLPTPGRGTLRYGGNTSCVWVSTEGWNLVLDAGSGIQHLGKTLANAPGRIDILLTHLHMDHIQGLGFFSPLFQPNRDIHIWGPPSTTRTLRRRLARYLSPPLFPVRVGDLPARLTCHDAPREIMELGPFRVRAELICHPDPTIGYRIACGGTALTYMPDHEPQLGRRSLPRAEWLSGFNLAEGTDLLIHDAQYTPEEYAQRVGWGHCTAELAVQFGEIVGVKRLALFHHDPDHSDEFIDATVLKLNNGTARDFRVFAAAEGQSLVL